MYILILLAMDEVYEETIDINIAVSEEKDELNILGENILSELQLYNSELSKLSKNDYFIFLSELCKLKEKYKILKEYKLTSIDYKYSNFRIKISKINCII